MIATFNAGKFGEMRELLASSGWTLISLRDIPGATAPPETGATLKENALIKARAAVALSGLPAIADDTGLEVDALQGRPGIQSARFAGPHASGPDNVRHLLELMEGIEPSRRGARFRTVCVACFPDRDERIGEGVLEGRITTRSRGGAGFGYDPVFEVAGLGRTLAELSPEEKNALSHRARALGDLMRQLGG